MKENNHEILFELAINYRGLVIEACITLEKVIEQFIYKYISNDEKPQLKIMIHLLDRMSFDAKISVFQSILKSSSETPKDFKKKYDSLLGKIRSIKDERNNFAHYMFDCSEDKLEKNKEITLRSFRDDFHEKTYNNEKINIIRENITRCLKEIGKISL